MKKLRSFFSPKTTFLACGCIVLLTLLSSCNNFLKSNETAQDIKSAIDYNNAPEYTVLLKSTENQLSFLSANEKIIKLGYSAQVDFTVNIDDFLFVKLEAVSKSDTSVSRADCIKFEYLEEDPKKGMYKVKITLLKAQNDIQIQPVCLEYPKVVSYSPAETQTSYSNRPVTINFNVPVDDSVTSMIELSMKNYNQPSDFFDAPVLSQDKKTVTLTPKPLLINNYMAEEEINSISISVHVKDDVTATVGETVLPLKKNKNQNFTVTYQPQTDYNAPIYKEGSFFVTRTPLTENTDISTVEKLSEDVFIVDETHNMNDAYYQGKKIYENRIGSHVYLCGSFADKDSGIGIISVCEEYRGPYYYGTEYYEPVITDYTIYSDNILYFTDSNGYTNFYINHRLKSDDGTVLLSISVSDVCGNTTKSSNEIICYKTSLQQIANDISLKNIISLPDYTEENFKEELHTIYLYTPEFKICSLYFADLTESELGENQIELIDTDILPYITCEYKHKDNTISKDNFAFVSAQEWKLKLDVEKISGLTLKIELTDYMGDTVVKEYTIPSSENYTYIQTEENNKSYVNFYYYSGEKVGNPYLIQINPDKSKKIYAENNEDLRKIEITEGCTYLPIPHTILERHEEYNYILVEFFTENPKNVSIIKESELTPNQEFVLEKYEETDEPFRLQKDSINNIMNVSIKIPQEAWNICDDIQLFVEDKAILFRNDTNDYNELGNLSLFLPKNSREYSFRTETSTLFESSTNITLYGIKNNKYKYKTPIEIPKLSENLEEYSFYDNNAPGYTWYKFYNYEQLSSNPLNDEVANNNIDFDNVILTISDRESQINCAYFIEGTDFYERYVNNFFEASKTLNTYPRPKELQNLIIYKATGPSEELEILVKSWFIKNGYSYYIKDMAGNITCGSNYENDTSYWNTTSVSYIGTNLSIHQETKGSSTRRFAYAYEFNGSTWTTKWNKKIIDFSSNNFSTTYTPTSTTSFIKFYTSCIRQITTAFTFENNFSIPFYAYLGLGTTSHDSTGDFLLPNGNGKDSVAIISKHPVLVQTLVSSQPYDVCKDWDYKEWIKKAKDIQNEKILDINTANLSSGADCPSQTKQYTIETKNIPSGACYCVIAHFADGHALISNVVEKK